MVRRIVAEVSRSDTTEFELQQGAFRLYLKRRPRGLTHGEAVVPAGSQIPGPTTLVRVLAPLTGIFYRAASPSVPPYVEVGDWVEPTTVVGLIETMKVFNEITADAAGRVANIDAQAGQLVHAGDSLLSIEPGDRPDGAPEGVS